VAGGKETWNDHLSHRAEAYETYIQCELPVRAERRTLSTKARRTLPRDVEITGRDRIATVV
jgi:hypothetical protein